MELILFFNFYRSTLDLYIELDKKRYTRDQTLALYQVGPEAIVSLGKYLQDEMDNLSSRVQALKGQNKRNSRNSSKPSFSERDEKAPDGIDEQTVERCSRWSLECLHCRPDPHQSPHRLETHEHHKKRRTFKASN